jgi:sugar lactone lactonase YvrE
MMMKTLVTMLVITLTLVIVPNSYSAESAKLVYNSGIYTDAKGGSLNLPEGVACGAAASVIVADTGNGRLLKYTFQDGSLKGGEEFKVAEAPRPLRVQTNSAGDIFVLDGKQRRIVRLSPEGTFKAYVDPTGIPAPASFVPKSFKIDAADNMYILDIFSGRVLVLDPAGKYLRHIDFPEKFGFFSDVAVDSRGTIFILDSADAVVYAAARDAKSFSPLSKSLEQYMNFPTDMTVDSSGLLYLSDQNGGGVVVIGQDGSFRGRPITYGWDKGLVRYPAQLCINEKGILFVADRENSRVQIYTLVK